MTTEWKDEFSLGIPEIDVQHRAYVALLGNLERGIELGAGAERIEKLFQDIENYATLHFATEESFFDRFGCYPEAEAHRKAHRHFSEGIAKVRAEYADNPRRMTGDVTGMLQKWLYDHILLMDKEYVSCFKANGL
jgi:methyl-accepting chemotaxis protein/hemerythrin